MKQKKVNASMHCSALPRYELDLHNRTGDIIHNRGYISIRVAIITIQASHITVRAISKHHPIMKIHVSKNGETLARVAMVSVWTMSATV